MEHRFSHPADPASAAQPLATHAVWLVLAGWLFVATPLFIGMPLNSDTALYDVQARTVMNGGVAYRDIIEPNLPGAVWIHLGIRSVAGWSSEVMRAFDLAVLSVILWLWSGVFSRRSQLTPVFLLAAAFFYLTRNEWCHAQRDTWMLLPAGAALTLRRHRTAGTRFPLALLEGLCWGCACWIKPHVTIPAAAMVLVDWQQTSFRAAVRDLLGVVAGTASAALPGLLWLIESGAWEHFREMMLGWNPEYVAAGRNRMSFDRWVMLSQRFAPWLWVHAVAIPAAVSTVLRFRRDGRGHHTRPHALLSGCYLGWLLQTVALQHALDYIHVPAIILGLAVVCRHPWQLPRALRRSIVLIFAACAILCTPFFRGHRLYQWPVVLREGSTTAVRAKLAHGNLPHWNDLGRVTEFLRERSVTDGAVTCMNVHSVHIYNELQIQPATRYWSVSLLQDLFPARAAAITDTVTASRHRFVVTESTEHRLLSSPVPNAWLEQLVPVFESGSYMVLEVLQTVPQVAERSDPARCSP